MFDKEKKTVKLTVLSKSRLAQAPPAEAPSTEAPVEDEPQEEISLIKIRSKEKLPMASPIEAEKEEAKRESPVTAPKPGEQRPGITIEFGQPNPDGSFLATSSSSFFPGRVEKTKFTNPFSAEFLDKVIDELRRSMQFSGEKPVHFRGADKGSAADQSTSDVIKLGQELFQSLFSDGLFKLYADTFDTATDSFPISIVTAEPSICRIPWEFLHDKIRFVCTHVGPIFRIVPNAPRQAPQLTVEEPVRLLIVATIPVGAVSISWQKEIEDIELLLQGSKIKIEMRVANSIGRFRQILLGWGPHIIHFIAHGESDRLIVPDETGKPVHMGLALAGMMSLLKMPPRLVLFNACDTGGLAGDLIQGRVPMAVGMQFAISDTAARAFSKGFYEYALMGLPLSKATAWGRMSIKTELGEKSSEWATPVLYANPKKVDLG